MPHPIATSRRRFLWSIGLGVTGLATGCQRQPETSLSRGPSQASNVEPLQSRDLISRTSRALGTEVKLTIAPPINRDPQTIFTAAFAALDRVEDVMSLYRPESELCRLNRDGRLPSANPMLIEVLRKSHDISSASDGAFDVTVQPLWDLYAEKSAPSDADLEGVVSQIDYRHISIQGESVALHRSSQVTLNGIAQGYALDVVRRTLSDHGVWAAMIDTGEVGAIGDKQEKTPWRAGIQHPTESEALAGVVALDGRCLATSGNYATRFAEGHHHLLDPRTGRSAAELTSVSVLAESGVLADALSTAAFILGPVEGMQLIGKYASVDAMMITPSGRTLTTGGFPIV